MPRFRPCTRCGRPMGVSPTLSDRPVCHPCRRELRSGPAYAERQRARERERERRRGPRGPRCAGCGKRMHKGRGVLPEGSATCRACRRERARERGS